MDSNSEEQAEADGVRRPEVSAPPVIEEAESVSPTANLVKVDALRRLKVLERRDKTVGTHLDELRALLMILFEQMPD